MEPQQTSSIINKTELDLDFGYCFVDGTHKEKSLQILFEVCRLSNGEQVILIAHNYIYDDVDISNCISKTMDNNIGDDNIRSYCNDLWHSVSETI